MRTPAVTRNAKLTAQATRLNGGSIKIYSGTRPTTGDTALGAQVLLVSLPLNATAAASVTGGVFTFAAITSAVIGTGGTASFARLFQSDGTTAEGDLSVGTSGTELIFPTVTFTAGVTAGLSALTITDPAGT